MLSFTDIVVVCLPLAAAILAVMKDSFTQEKPGDSKQEKPPKKKITPLGVAALFLALIGFGLSLHSTREAKKVAQAEADHKNHITTAVDTVLPDAISEARRKLNDSVSEVVNESKSKLETAIRDATQQSGAEVQAAIQSSGDAVARNLATEISRSQARINANLRTTESKINDSITHAQTGISTVVEQSDDNLKKSVTGAVNASGEIITEVISQAVKEQTQNIGEMAKTAVGEQIMQIPLRIDQHQIGRLGGPLSDITVKVEDVRKDRPFDVHVYHEGTELFTRTIGPTKKEKAVQPISFMHPGTHKSYRLEVTVQTQRNLFGTGLDYIVIRAMNDSPVARK